MDADPVFATKRANNVNILLHEIWPIANPDSYKLHFARENEDKIKPLDVWVRMVEKLSCRIV